MKKKKFASQVRALRERVRQPNSVRLIAGLSLIAPAALIGNDKEHLAPVAATQQLAPLVIDISPDALDAGLPPEELAAAAQYAKEYRIAKPLAHQIHKAAVAHGISIKTAFGLVRAESAFRPRVASPVGAIGLTQVMPATARWLEPGTTKSDLMDPSTNLRLGFTYLKQLIKQYDGNENLALTAFNRGPGTVARELKRGRNPDNGYAEKVLTGKSTKHVALMNAKFGAEKSTKATVSKTKKAAKAKVAKALKDRNGGRKTTKMRRV